ncbi:MAG: efflux RND transporter permease subunit [Planctomycetaceae bacterium]
MNATPQTRLYRLTGLVVRHALPISIVGLIVTVAAVYPAAQLSFDQSIESLYADEDPHLRDFLDSKRLFGGDELAGVVYRDPELLRPEGLTRVAALSEELSRVAGVRAESTQDLASGLEQANSRFLQFLKGRRARVLDFFRGILIGDDDETTAVVLRLKPENHELLRQGRSGRGQTIETIRSIAAEHQRRHGFETHVVGEPVQVHDMFRYVQRDGLILGWVSLALLVLVILVLFRNLRWVLLPVLIVQATLLWTKGILVLSRLQLSMVSSILESLVTIIGVATVMHIALVYCGLRRELGREAALHRTLYLLAPDIFWVCATTAGGFAAQLSSHVYPVKSFGLMMTLGSMLVLVAIGVFLPGGVLLGRYGSEPDSVPGDRHLGRWLSVLCEYVERRPWNVLGGCLVVTIAALAGMSRIRVETDFSRNFRESSPIVRALDFVEQRLGGAGTWEVNFDAPEELDDEYLERVSRLAQRLRDIELSNGHACARLTKVLAITDGLELVPRIPILLSSLDRRLNALGQFQPEFVTSLYNPDGRRMRIVLRAVERQPAELKQRLIARVEELAREEFPAGDPERQARATGLFVLLTFLIESLLGDQWASFLWGAAGIISMVTLAYRSLRIGLLALIPNLLPIALVVGAMGWLDLPINIATAMISSVSMGLTVDASIFYISAFHRMQQQGLSFSEALQATQHDVGRALIYSNLALILGFLVLTLSQFIPLVYFGLLVSVAMVGGLAGNLVLLPLLLRATRPRKGPWS